MRRIAFVAVAMTALAALAVPAGAAPSNNWHVHDGGLTTINMRHAGVVFFPTLFSQEGDTYQPATDPAVCPDATDKVGTLLNGAHTNRHHVNGVCQTDEYVIHLRSASGGSDQIPDDWDWVPFGSDKVYYRLTPRG